MSNRQIAQLITQIKARGVFVFDLETTSLNFRQGVIEGIAIYIPGGKGFKPVRAWLPFVPGTMPSRSSILDRSETISQLKPVFEDEAIMAIAHHGKFDVPWLEECGVEFKARFACSMVAMYMADEGRRSYKLRDLADEFFGIEIITYKEAKDRQLRFGFDRKKELGEYAMDQVEATWRVFCHAIKSIRRQDSSGQLERLYWNLEMPVVKILMEMERSGVLIDPRPLWNLDSEITDRRKEIEEKILDKMGWLPRFEVPGDISRLIYGSPQDGGLGLSPGSRKRNASGHYSTKRSDIEVWARRNKTVGLVIEWRHLKSVQENYIARMLKASDEEKRVHCQFNQHRHPIGRMTSSQPIGLTDMPKHAGIRRAICSHYSGDEESADLEFLDIDYNQLELRVLAHLSQDEKLMKVYKTETCGCDSFLFDGRCRHTDIHTLVAERLDISRDRAKAVNYGIIYGMGPDLLAKSADLVTAKGALQRKKALALIEAWYEFFEGVRLYFGRVRKGARSAGWIVRAQSGRLLRLDKDLERYNSKSKRQELGRKVCHFSVSGFATDLVKKAMINIGRLRDRRARSDERWGRVRFVLQVHDQFLIQFPKDLRDEVVREIGQEAERAGDNLDVPITVNMKVGTNWEELVDVRKIAA